jgi:hypothetical protein
MTATVGSRSIVAHFFWSEADLIDGTADFVEAEQMTVEEVVAYLRRLAVDCRKASDAATAGRKDILP